MIHKKLVVFLLLFFSFLVWLFLSIYYSSELDGGQLGHIDKLVMIRL